MLCFSFFFLQDCTFSVRNMRPREGTVERKNNVPAHLSVPPEPQRQKLLKCISLKDNHHNVPGGNVCVWCSVVNIVSYSFSSS